jgi:23S rRNA pseudouridine2605 synthase
MSEDDKDDAPDAPEAEQEKGGEQIAPEVRGERIAKWLARAGVASRRDAEKLIAEGKVKLNGKPVDSPATFVGPGDRISVAGKPVAAPERTRLFRYHKPEGLVTTHRDPEGRTTVFEKLPAALPRVVSIGRLDITSEGLLLLTNDGELARRLELPSNGWLRRYRVRVFGAVDERALAKLARGITVDGVAYGPIEAGLDSRQGGNAWLTISLKEGKNREVRRVMAHLGLQVTRLIRVAYGPFQLGALPRGGVEEVHPRIMREQLGIGEKPARPRRPDPPAPGTPGPKPDPKPPGRAHTIPRARNAAPRRPTRAANRRRPPSRP